MRVVALALAVTLAGPFAASAAAARPGADLSVGSAKAELTNGRLVVDLVARNRGVARARPSLAAISWRPVQGRRVGRSVVLRRVRLMSVRDRGRRALRASLALPAGAAGVYAVRVCLDIRDVVRERREHDNCRSAGDVVVPSEAAPPQSAAAAPPAPVAPGAPVVPVDPTPALPAPGPDVTPPNTTIIQAPPVVYRLAVASFVFASSERGSTLECRLDAAPWATCTSPQNFSSLPEGPHRFQVRAKDAAGNVDPTPAVHDWTVDLTRPDVAITTFPARTVATSDASFAFSSTDATATFECSTDAGAWAACTSPAQLTGLADGPHTFVVRAVDAALNTSSPFASENWTVDTTGPDTSITNGPSGDVPAGDVSVDFGSPEAGATFECRLDGADWTPCSSPLLVAAPAAGPHTLDVRALDALGNPDPSPASAAWTSLAPDPPPAP